MKEQNVAKTYARAFLDLGTDKKINIVDELVKLTEVINTSNSLENVLFLDIFTKDEKKAVFDSIAKKVDLSQLTSQMVTFLIEEKRINLLPLLIKECVVIDDDKRGFIRGYIEGVADEVDPAIKKQIETYLKTKLGKEPKLSYKRNAQMSAGYKVTAEDLQLDASLDSQLEHIKQSVLS